jgi:hypothetical protein
VPPSSACLAPCLDFGARGEGPDDTLSLHLLARSDAHPDEEPDSGEAALRCISRGIPRGRHLVEIRREAITRTIITVHDADGMTGRIRYSHPAAFVEPFDETAPARDLEAIPEMVEDGRAVMPDPDAVGRMLVDVVDMVCALEQSRMLRMGEIEGHDALVASLVDVPSRRDAPAIDADLVYCVMPFMDRPFEIVRCYAGSHERMPIDPEASTLVPEVGDRIGRLFKLTTPSDRDPDLDLDFDLHFTPVHRPLPRLAAIDRMRMLVDLRRECGPPDGRADPDAPTA